MCTFVNAFDVYVKPEDKAAYYVVNSDFSENFWLLTSNICPLDVAATATSGYQRRLTFLSDKRRVKKSEGRGQISEIKHG